jgi:hypothetical protein
VLASEDVSSLVLEQAANDKTSAVAAAAFKNLFIFSLS